MTQSYSLDPRVRIADFVEADHSRCAAARHFEVSDSCAIKLMRRRRCLDRTSRVPSWLSVMGDRTKRPDM
jgi:hypothetical protein